MNAGLTTDQVARRFTPVLLRMARWIRPSSGELSAGHFSVLATLHRYGPQRPSDLARIEKLSPPATTRAIGTLGERGLVHRAPSASDARSSLVEITGQGVELLTGARLHQAGIVAGLLAELTPDELELVSRALVSLERLTVHPNIDGVDDPDDAVAAMR